MRGGLVWLRASWGECTPAWVAPHAPSQTRIRTKKCKEEPPPPPLWVKAPPGSNLAPSSPSKSSEKLFFRAFGANVVMQKDFPAPLAPNMFWSPVGKEEGQPPPFPPFQCVSASSPLPMYKPCYLALQSAPLLLAHPPPSPPLQPPPDHMPPPLLQDDFINAEPLASVPEQRCAACVMCLGRHSYVGCQR